MKRFKITHKTDYSFSAPVEFMPHTLRLRPREGHDLRIESSVLTISPTATLRWRRDIEDNTVAIATFTESANKLSINSEIVVQQYDHAPFDFLVANYAVDYPFEYDDNDKPLLTPYLKPASAMPSIQLIQFLDKLLSYQGKIQTFSLLHQLNHLINESIGYQKREEEGVHSAEESLTSLSGSCRDLAFLFIQAARELGFASRFVSGYIHSGTAATLYGSTHAWAEVFIPGAGWKGFDPTNDSIVGEDHLAVAVARSPEAIPPVSGKFFGTATSCLEVVVTVRELFQV